jgi:site-specific DNA-methyltransferase (adenine-specific)
MDNVLKIEEIIFNDDNYSNVKNNSIDFILTDPPFNIARKTNFHTYKDNTIHSYKFDSDTQEEWDTFSHEDFIKELYKWSSEFSRVLKKGGNFAIFCADSYISYFIDALKENGLSPRRVISWTKPNAVPINRAYMPTSAVEYIIVGVKGSKATFNSDVKIVKQSIDDKIIEAVVVAEKASSVVNSLVRQSLLESSFQDIDHIDSVINLVREVLLNNHQSVLDRVENMYKYKDGEKYLQACIPNHISLPSKSGNRIHPTEKPVYLLQYLLSLYSKVGDVVLDPFAGSGSTGEASIILKRVPVLIEREHKFYEKAVKRLEKII